MAKRRKKDLLDTTLDIGAVSAGTVFAGGMPHLMSRSMPGTESLAGTIGTRTSSSLALIPTTMGVGAAFGSMGMLRDVQKKAKRKK